MDISQRDLLATGYNCHAQVWRNPFRNVSKDPYMTHSLHGSQISDLRFAPFEDVLGIGHSDGFSSIVVPGLCHANALHSHTELIR